MTKIVGVRDPRVSLFRDCYFDALTRGVHTTRIEWWCAYLVNRKVDNK